MRAIVLVGGEGTRLRPLTWRTPKQLVPILNRPLLEHLLRYLHGHDVKHVTLAMTQRSEAIREALGDGSALGVELDYAYEETPLGSGGAIASVARGWSDEGSAADEPFLVLNGDILTDLDLGAMIAAHRERSAELSISLVHVDDPSPFGVAVLEGVGADARPEGPTRIERFVEKPPRESAPSRWINAGVWIFDRALLREMDQDRFHRVENELFPALAESGRALLGVPHEGYWMDIGNPRTYLRANLDLVAAGTTCVDGATVEAGAELTGPALIGARSVIATGARVEGPAVIGERCRIEAGARVAGSVLWDDVTVGAGATVEGSVLASGAVIGEGATLDGAVVAHEAVVAPGAAVPRGHAIEPAVTFTNRDVADGTAG
jgi:NDP-sugar pyrophosphorylase family protein